jgi:hypothetical protein
MHGENMKVRANSPWLLAIGLAVSAAIAVWIAYGHSTPHTAYRPDAAPIVLDPLHGVCDVERLELVCARGMGKGWPPCTLAPGGVLVEQGDTPMVLDEKGDPIPTHGAVGVREDGRRVVVLSPDATCEKWDWTLEHEILCHLDYGIGHLSLTGSVCAGSVQSQGDVMPERRSEP